MSDLHLFNDELIKQEKRLSKKPRISILGIGVDVLNTNETVELVNEYVVEKEPLHLIGVNADKINECDEDEHLKEIVNSCGVVNADGVSVVLAGKILGKPLPERVAGIDLMNELLMLCENKGYTTYFLGAKREVIEKAVEKIRNDHPMLNVLGFREGYFDESEWPSITEEINNLSPQFVFVGISSPIKEYLIEHFQNSGMTSVFMGVGGSFDVISGMIPRAPLWMRKCSLEWLFRLIKEPKRLFKRYFFGNIKFIKKVIKSKIDQRNDDS